MIPDLADRITDYENGDLTDEQTVKLFQDLVDTGMAWQLQGSYGRTAHQMIAEGLVEKRARKPIQGAWPTSDRDRIQSKNLKARKGRKAK